MSAQPDPLWDNGSRDDRHAFGMPFDPGRDEPAGPRPRASERLAAAAAAVEALAGLDHDAWQLTGDQLGAGVGMLWRLRQVIDGQLVGSVQEATRGEAGPRPKDWLTAQAHAASDVPVDPADVAAIVTVAEATRVDAPRGRMSTPLCLRRSTMDPWPATGSAWTPNNKPSWPPPAPSCLPARCAGSLATG